MHTAQHALQMERTAQTPPRAWFIRLHVRDHPRDHLLDLDYGLAWSLIFESVVRKALPHLWSRITFLLLIPLAITSFDIWKKRLGKNWKRLHQTVYFIAPLVVLHFALSKKGDIFQLQGDVMRPLIYGLVVLLLLVLRIPKSP